VNEMRITREPEIEIAMISSTFGSRYEKMQFIHAKKNK
jgi:hypothetical protein